jgi:Tfp pilus assembly protein PilF
MSAEPAALEVDFESGSLQSIKRIELRQTDRDYRLELEFNLPLTLPPLHYRQDDQLWLQLFATELSQVRLPPLAEAMPIKQWQAYQEAGRQMIMLRLEPSYQAELTQLRPRVWVLRLHRSRGDVELPEQAPPRLAHEASSPGAVRLRRSEDGFSTAQQALAKGQQQRAERLLRKLLADQPEHLPASLLLSQLYLSQDHPERAEPVILTAMQHHPDHPDLITHWARCLMAEERLAEAATYLLKAMHSDNASHLGLLATIRQRQQAHRQARNYFLQALRLNPREATWLAGLGISQEQLGEEAEARQAYRRALGSGKLNLTLQGFVETRLSEMNRKGD